MHRHIRHRAALAIALIGLLVVTGSAAPAAAGPTGPNRLILHRQGLLNDMADEVDAVAVNDPGHSMTAIDIPTNTVVVYRVGGEPPAAKRAAVASRDGATVTYRSALLTDKQTRAVVDAVDRAGPQLAKAGVEVVSVGPEPGGPVVIGVARLNAAAEALADRFATFGAGTVRVEQQALVIPNGRQNDSPPYYGGGIVKLPANQGRCTAGFPGRHSNGRTYVLTSYHCLDNNDRRFWDGRGQLMGTVSPNSVVKRRDLVAIYARSTHWIWDGAYNEQTFRKEVTQARPPRRGDNVCVSGAFSGTTCYAMVVSWSVVTMTGVNGDRFSAELWYADSIDNRAMAGHGDSGGPVFIPNADYTSVTALGSHSASTGANMPCRGIPDRDCGTRIHFSDAATQAYEWGLTLTNN